MTGATENGVQRPLVDRRRAIREWLPLGTALATALYIGSTVIARLDVAIERIERLEAAFERSRANGWTADDHQRFASVLESRLGLIETRIGRVEIRVSTEGGSINADR